MKIGNRTIDLTVGVHWVHWALAIGVHFNVGFAYLSVGPFYASVDWYK